MAGQKCINCNAVLPLGDPGAVVVCPFCSAQNRAAGAVPPPPVLPPLGGRRTETTTFGRIVLLVVVLSIFGIIGVTIWKVTRAVTEAATSTRTVTGSTTVTVTRPGNVTVLQGDELPVNDLFELTPEGNVLLKIPGVELAPHLGTRTATLVPASPPTPPAEKLVPPAELATLEKGRWIALDPAGLPGGFATFDPTAAVPWFLAAARRWSADARFERIAVDGVRADGTTDLSAGESDVEYRLYSPALRASAVVAAAVSTEPVYSELRLRLAHGRLEAMLDRHGGHEFESPDDFEVQCSMPRVLELLRGHGLSPLPSYELTMSCSDGPCKWMVHPPHDGPALAAWKAGVPEIPAGDCSRFPETPRPRGR